MDDDFGGGCLSALVAVLVAIVFLMVTVFVSLTLAAIIGVVWAVSLVGYVVTRGLARIR